MQLFAETSSFSVIFQLVNGSFSIAVDGILGLDFLSKFEAQFDFKSWFAYLVDDDGINCELKLLDKPCDEMNKIMTIEHEEIMRSLRKNFPERYAKGLERL